MDTKEDQTKDSQKVAKSYTQFILAGTLIVISIAVLVSASWLLFQHTVSLLTVSLITRLEAIVDTAAVQFDADDLAALDTESDYKKPEWNRVVTQLINIRKNNSDIVFAYILRKKTDDPDKMIFVADSHSLDPYAKIDLDGNGVIDDADALNPPGDVYDDAPVEAWQAYNGTVVTGELYEDQWGVLTSGYAPIRDEQGNTVAVMTVDVRAGDFSRITRQTLRPFIGFMVALVLIILVLAIGLIRLWNKRVQLLAELDKQKDELLSIVSHQLATPVSSVKWYIEMLMDGDVGKLTKDQEEHMKPTLHVLHQLKDLIFTLLDVSRIQLGKVRVEPKEIVLQELVDDVVSVIEPKVQEKDLKFVQDIEDADKKVLIDPRLTNLVLSNLLSNAVKYTEKGEVKFSLKVRADQIFIEVSDTGYGIPLKDQEKIFGKLYRATNASAEEGNGLGLYATKGAVENMGGTISFKSRLSEGTTFFVELPARQDEKVDGKIVSE